MNNKYFFGEELTQLELDKGYVSYHTLSKCGDAVLVDIDDYENLELECGEEFDEYGDCIEIFQFYIISKGLAAIIKEYAPDEILYYHNKLDCYVWGITHWRTSWEYVSTQIKIEDI